MVFVQCYQCPYINMNSVLFTKIPNAHNWAKLRQCRFPQNSLQIIIVSYTQIVCAATIIVLDKLTYWMPVYIQIKICAEYQDMLPRPRLVCRNPGLRPIGRSPGVPDKSSRGLGSMSWYSEQILICFIAYIFHFFYSSVGLVGNFAGLPVCTVPSAIVHCNQNEAGHQTIKAPSMPCWGAAGPSKHSLAFMPHTGEIDI